MSGPHPHEWSPGPGCLECVRPTLAKLDQVISSYCITLGPPKTNQAVYKGDRRRVIQATQPIRMTWVLSDAYSCYRIGLLRHALLAALLISSVIYHSSALTCKRNATMTPIRLNDDLALMAGDVVVFESADPPGFLSAVDPGVRTREALNDKPFRDTTCSPIPLYIAPNRTKAAQFIVLPIATIDPDLEVGTSGSGQATSIIDAVGDLITDSITDETPKLVSTVQLVHVADGRLLGMYRKRKCKETIAVDPEIEDLFDDIPVDDAPWLSTSCEIEITLVPMLLPRSFNEPCTYKLEDFETVWDLQVYSMTKSELFRRSNRTFVDNAINQLINQTAPLINETLNNIADGTPQQAFSHVFKASQPTSATRLQDVFGDGTVIAEVPLDTSDTHWEVFQASSSSSSSGSSSPSGGLDPSSGLSILGIGNLGNLANSDGTSIAGETPSSIADAVGLSSAIGTATPLIDLAVRQNNENLQNFDPATAFTPAAEAQIAEQQRQFLQRAQDDIFEHRLGEEGAAALAKRTASAVVGLRLRMTDHSLVELVTPCRSYVTVDSDDQLDAEFGPGAWNQPNGQVASESSSPSMNIIPDNRERFLDGRSLSPFDTSAKVPPVDDPKNNSPRQPRRVRMFKDSDGKKTSIFGQIGETIVNAMSNGYSHIMSLLRGSSETDNTTQRPQGHFKNANSRVTVATPKPEVKKKKRIIFSSTAKEMSLNGFEAHHLRRRKGDVLHRRRSREIPEIPTRGKMRGPLSGFAGHPLAVFDIAPQEIDDSSGNQAGPTLPSSMSSAQTTTYKGRHSLSGLSREKYASIGLTQEDIEYAYSKAKMEYSRPIYAFDAKPPKRRRSYLDGDLDPLSTSTASDLHLEALMQEGLKAIEYMRLLQEREIARRAEMQQRGMMTMRDDPGEQEIGEPRSDSLFASHRPGSVPDDTDEIDHKLRKWGMMTLFAADVFEMCPKWWGSELITLAQVLEHQARVGDTHRRATGRHRFITMNQCRDQQACGEVDPQNLQEQMHKLQEHRRAHILRRLEKIQHKHNITFAEARRLRRKRRQLLRRRKGDDDSATFQIGPRTVFRMEAPLRKPGGRTEFAYRKAVLFGDEEEVEIIENPGHDVSACNLNHLRGNFAVMRAAQQQSALFDIDDEQEFYQFMEDGDGGTGGDEGAPRSEHPGCTPTTGSCSAGTASNAGMLWSLTRLPFADVPTSSLFLSESMTEVSYNLDGAFADIMPFAIGQLALRNYSPFEQFLSARALKRVYFISTFRWSVGIQPSAEIAFTDVPGVVSQAIDQLVLPGLGALVGGLLNIILPGSQAVIDQIVTALQALFPVATLGVSLLTLAVPITWSGSYSHAEEYELAATFALSAAPLTHLIGRGVMNVGRNSVPFTVDINRKLYVPPGAFGQIVGQVIDFDYTVPGIFEGANLVSTEFIVDTL